MMMNYIRKIFKIPARRGVDEEAIAAIARVHADNATHMVADPNGDYPKCKTALGTWRCERCGADARFTEGEACPAVPKSRRWRIEIND